VGKEREVMSLEIGFLVPASYVFPKIEITGCECPPELKGPGSFCSNCGKKQNSINKTYYDNPFDLPSDNRDNVLDEYDHVFTWMNFCIVGQRVTVDTHRCNIKSFGDPYHIYGSHIVFSTLDPVGIFIPGNKRLFDGTIQKVSYDYKNLVIERDKLVEVLPEGLTEPYGEFGIWSLHEDEE